MTITPELLDDIIAALSVFAMAGTLHDRRMQNVQDDFVLKLGDGHAGIIEVGDLRRAAALLPKLKAARDAPPSDSEPAGAATVEELDHLTARLKDSATFVSDNYQRLDSHGGWSNLRRRAADAIDRLRKDRDAAFTAGQRDMREKAAQIIENGYERPVGKPYRKDGVPSKNDECSHGRWMYQDCEACTVAAIRTMPIDDGQSTDDIRATIEAETVAKIVAWLRRDEWHFEWDHAEIFDAHCSTTDAIERGEWRK